MKGYLSIQELVERSLRRDITFGTFPPGSRLIERELVIRYEASRGPIREALRVLEAQGLVSHEPNRGVRVARLSLNEMTEIYQMRALLEGLAARCAADNADDSAVEAVKDAHRIVSMVPRDSDAWLQANNDFHCRIYELANMPTLLELVRQLMQRVNPYAQLYLDDETAQLQSVHEHTEIVDAFVNHNASACEALTRAHLKNAGEVMLQMLNGLDQHEGAH